MFKNYGDITKIDGGNVEFVDCIIGGSPCTSFSQAGNRTGFEGESGLFLHQIRIVNEMRVKSEGKYPRYMVLENVLGILNCNNGKDFQRVLMECINVAVRTSTNNKSNQQQYNKNKELLVPDVPLPKGGKWPKSGLLYDEMGRWSIAWRLHDAQYWGVAQRRRRIALVCDFGGMSAPEVLFESQSVQRDSDTCNTQGERTSETSVGSPEDSDKIWDARGNGNGRISATITGDHDNRITDYTNDVVQREESYSINGDAHESGVSIMSEVSHALKTTTKESVFVKQSSEERNPEPSYPCICIGNGQANVTDHYTEEVSQTLNCMHDAMTILEPCAYQLVGVNSNSMKSSNPHSGVYEAETSRTLNTVSCGNHVCYHGGMAVVEPVIPLEGNGCRESHKGDGWSTEQVSYTLNTVERYGIAYGETESSIESHPITIDRAANNQGQNAKYEPQIKEADKNPTLVANCYHAVVAPVAYKVRRLTPLECTRLQGFPDGWVDIGDWVDSKGKKHKESNAPKYRALGNSIALPFWKWLCKNIVNQIRKSGNEFPTMASLFAGIGGFDICWLEATGLKDSILWVSEIEEFPIAVLKYHFS